MNWMTRRQILIDYFGEENIRYQKQKQENAPDGFIRVRNIQYENALGFCVMMSDQLTLLSPPNLVSKVHEKLSAIVKKYEPQG